MDGKMVARELVEAARELAASDQLRALRLLNDIGDHRLDIKEVRSGVFSATNRRDGVPLELSRTRGRPNWHSEFSFSELEDWMGGRMTKKQYDRYLEALN